MFRNNKGQITLLSVLAGAVLVATAVFFFSRVNALSLVTPKDLKVYAQLTGAIFTTNLGCTGTQDVNQYSAGQTVTIHFKDFTPASVVSWAIKGQPGGASCNPNQIVAHGTVTIGADGTYCANAVYTITSADCGEDDVKINDVKGANYSALLASPRP